MYQNLKVDIIYYNTNTDFELEFNLCGCCRMRLLTDKASEQKSLVHMLARGVSRSRIIIVIGSLFGDNGIINLVSSAIGTSLEKTDNAAYGISGNDEISILKGSTPLVTSEGYFGGCIIESGPQTMILLTENKSIRKTIMHTLIHPYVEELSAIALKEKAAGVQKPETKPESAPIAETPETIAEEVIPVSDIAEQPTEEKTPESEPVAGEQEDNAVFDDVQTSDGMIFTAEDGDKENDTKHSDNSQLFVEAGVGDYTQKSYYTGNEYNAEVDDFVFNKPRNRGSGKFNFNMLILIVTIILLVAVAALCFCVFYIPAKNDVTAVQYIRDIFKTLFA